MSNHTKKLRLKFCDLGSIMPRWFEEHETPKQCVEDNLKCIPGIDPISAEVITAHIDGDDIIAEIIVNPQDWVKWCVQLGEDILDILAELQGQLNTEEMHELMHWIRTTDLTKPSSD